MFIRLIPVKNKLFKIDYSDLLAKSLLNDEKAAHEAHSAAGHAAHANEDAKQAAKKHSEKHP